MRRTDYQLELSISGTQKKGGNNSKKEVKKIQEWLSLHGHAHRNWGTITTVDGDFGPGTERAVKNFQSRKGLTANGIVTESLFKILSAPMKEAFEGVSKTQNLRSTICTVAEQHLREDARELFIKGQGNMGPWVRAYMKGNEGANWFWCAGFVSSIMDQAFNLWNKSADVMSKYSWNCDEMAKIAKSKNVFIPFETYRKKPSLVKPGDIFLVRNNKSDWTHTGIVLKVSGNVFTTIEGNTNEGGSSNGYGVLKRVRNFQLQKLDICSLYKWAGDELQPELKTVKLHSRGSTVRFLEEELVKMGYSNVFVSNYFGASTEVAVKDLQRKKGLVPDGIVGPKTWSAIV